MSKTIAVLGATGNLGTKIITNLIKQGADVIALVRPQSSKEKVQKLTKLGAKICVHNMHAEEVAQHLIGVDCAVSALAGLRDTIIDAQKIFVDAAVLAKVPRFIPSDFSSDFTNLVPGQNRNLDWRREFHQYLSTKLIAATTIFNGPFMELLTTDMPLIMFKQKKILCWGNPDQIIEFTTTHNIAEFTAHAALEDSTPRYLRIAGATLSCNGFVQLLTQLTGKQYKLFRPGGIGMFNIVIKLTRFFSPSKTELYPAWQGMQYMRDIMEGRIIFQSYDNARYPGIQWTSLKQFLEQEQVAAR
jgi:hypothetical protein